jgi:hypothetical protein
MTLDELEAAVAKMRALGVTEFGDIKLGPQPAAPAKELTPEEYKARLAKAEERRHEIMFAASATRPYLRSVKK